MEAALFAIVLLVAIGFFFAVKADLAWQKRALAEKDNWIRILHDSNAGMAADLMNLRAQLDDERALSRLVADELDTARAEMEEVREFILRRGAEVTVVDESTGSE